jgi:hypothetical protein
MEAMMKAVDEDESGEVDLCEFIEFMHNMKGQSDEDRERRGTKTPTQLAEAVPHEHTPIQEVTLSDLTGGEEDVEHVPAKETDWKSPDKYRAEGE